MSIAQRFEGIFVFDDGEKLGPNVRPKDAAVLILHRRVRGKIRILMGRRHKSHAFLPGRFVFPGGRIEPADQLLAVGTNLRPEVLAKAAAGITEARARGLALAAIRETYEETGLIVGSRNSPLPATRSPAWRQFLTHGLAPRLEGLDFIARAITPPGRPRRFDARFFMAGEEEIAGGEALSHTDGELKSLSWMTLDEARKADIIPITRCIIEEIEARLHGEGGQDRPVPFFVPHRGRAVVKEL
jgi:8-oxo-dGTP pyrophosphatase MutT (NUDIX family)